MNLIANLRNSEKEFLKVLRVMKITFLFLLVAICSWANETTSYAQVTEIRLSAGTKTLQEVFSEIEKETEFIFFYNDNAIDLSRKVTVQKTQGSIEEILAGLLENTGAGYKIVDRQIVFYSVKDIKNEKTAIAGIDQQKKTVTGLLTDADGNPIIGATVAIKGTTHGVTTDIDGKYILNNVSEGDVIEFRYIGFNTEEKVYKGEKTINIRMVEASVGLEDVVVIGYGQQKKESVVASVNTLNAGEIKIKNRNLRNSIAGQIPGVIAIQRSGEPGNDGAAFYIRGQSSYAGGTSPLVLVDGVPRSMDDIDVDEIETFTVLKDASATAVYGAEGANGVVLITSKRGKAQKTSMNFTAQYSLVRPTRMPELVDAYNYLSLYNEGLWNEQGNPSMDYFLPETSDDILNKYKTGVDPDLYPNVNWMDLLSNHTQSQRYTINFRGGSERTQFFTSGSYYSEDGIFKSNPMEQYDANIGLQRFNLRSNVDMTLTKTTKLAVDMSGQYLRKNTPGYGSDAIFAMISHFPTHLIPMYYSDGTASDHPNPDTSLRSNPYNMLNNSGYMKQWQAFLQTKVTLRQDLDFITKGLSVRGSVSFDANFASTMKRTKVAQTFIASGRDENGELIKTTLNDGTALGNPAQEGNSGNKKIYLEGAFDYKHTFNEKHDVTGLLLYMQKETQYQKESGLKLLPYRKQSVVFRSTYGYDDRYMLEASFGATGSENFASGNRWGIFPAIGAAWYISHEKFMSSILDYVNKLKVRASFGIAGNDDIGDTRFPYRESLNSDGAGYNWGLSPGNNGGPGNNLGGIVENTFPMPTLSWEKEKKLNIGFDLGLFRNQIDLSVDYFKNRRSDILIQRKTIPDITGFRNNPYQNFGITDNRGFDATLVLKQKAGNVNLSMRGNITYAKNEIIEQDEIPQKYSWMSATGQSIGKPLLYIAEGLYTPDDFNITTDPSTGAQSYVLKENMPRPAAASNLAPGDIKYKDLNNDGLIDAYDKSYDHNYYAAVPEIVYGFGFDAEWKGLFVGVFFQGAAHASANLMSNVLNLVPFRSGKDNSSARIEALNRWTAEDPYNQNVLFPRTRSNFFQHNYEASTWWFRDAGFLRLKNVEIGYEFKKEVIKKLKMNNLRVFLQGSNIAVWDKIKYWDPELGAANSGAKYPICGTYTLGLEVTF